METEMERIKKNEKLLIFLLILVFLTLIAFTTLAYFRYRFTSEPIIITTNDLTFNIVTEEIIHNEEINPTTWSNNMEENDNNEDIARVKLNVNSSSKINATYKVNIQSTINKNELYTGGNVSDIKYKVYNKDNLIKEGTFADELDAEIITGVINTESNLNENYVIYIYIEETNLLQDSLKEISFDFKFVGEANQIEE